VAALPEAAVAGAVLADLWEVADLAEAGLRVWIPLPSIAIISRFL